MQTRNQIIEKLFIGKNFNDCIKGAVEPGLQDDLKMEVISRLCELEECKIIELEERKELEFYTVRIILNEIKNKYSGFSKKFRPRYEELNGHEFSEDVIDEERELREDLELYTIEQLNFLPFVEGEMIKLYMEVGTYRKMEEATTIPYSTCYKSVHRGLDMLRKKVNTNKPKPIFTKEELRTL